MWFSREERITLTVLGVAALVALGTLLWQQQRPALTVAGQPASAQAARWDQLLDAARRVDVNTASAAELERLPEVGPVLAQRIVEYRTRHGRFHSPEELQRVRGIGTKTYEALRRSVTAN